jgi:dolichol-phosphate mannosyltransferase
VLALAIFSPVIIWNWQTGWASFAFQTTRRMAEKAAFSLHALVASAAVMITPTGLADAGVALAACGRSARDDAGEPARRRSRFILAFTLVPLAVFVAFSLRHKVKLEWTGPLWVAVLPAIAAGIIAPGGAVARFARFVHRAWEPTILAMVVLFGAGLHYLVLGLPGIGYPAMMHLVPVGWRDLAGQVDVAVRKVTRETGRPPLVVGLDRYFTSSEFAFYSADPQAALSKAAGVHLFGLTSLMYERWFPAFLQEGRDIVLVGWDAVELMHPVFTWHSGRLGPIERGTLSKNGKVIRDFHHRVLHGYREKPQK